MKNNEYIKRSEASLYLLLYASIICILSLIFPKDMEIFQTAFLTWSFIWCIILLGFYIILDRLLFKKLLYNNYKRKPLFSSKEKELFKLLLERLKTKKYWNNYYVLSHVRLNDLFDIKKGTDWEETIDIWVLGHVDFLIINKNDLKPELAIELNWFSHCFPKQRRMDKVKEHAFESCEKVEIKFRTIKNKDLWKWEETIKKIDTILDVLKYPNAPIVIK